jgi:histidine triad (HIT) family protein
MNTDKQQEANCFICRKHRGEIIIPGGAIYEDDIVYAGHLRAGAHPTYLGYLMAEMKRHTPGLAELTNQEAQALGLLVTRLSRALKACEGAEHIYSCVLGHDVPHMHIHVVPRYPGTPREYWGTRVDEWPDPHHMEARKRLARSVNDCVSICKKTCEYASK